MRTPRITFKTCRILLATTALICASSFPAFAVGSLTTPTGEVVTAGAATFDRPAAGQLNINQSTDRVAINWDNFDIGRNASTEFFQPGTNSLAVNRVVGDGQDPTQILGNLRANGKVMILDRNGVLFGRNSHVDVGSIVASTGNVTDFDVMNGDDRINITGMADAAIENRGDISVADAGLAAFVAPTVRNSGTITARLGRVSMGAGSAATVDLFGDGLLSLAVDSELEHALIQNRGDIFAEAGQVQMATSVAQDIVDNTINMDGVVDVSSVDQQGGRIILRGAQDTNIRGDLIAGNQGGGGDIRVDSMDINVARNAQLRADTTFTGIGGTVRLNAANSINSAGTITANGEEGGGRVVLAAGDNATVTGRTEARGTGIGSGGLIRISSGGDETRIASTLNAGGIDGAGTIDLRATNTLNLTDRSRLNAQSLSTLQGGTVRLTGTDINADGRMNVSGMEGGGVVRIVNSGDLNLNGTINGTGDVVGTGARIRALTDGDINVNSRMNVSGRSGGGSVLLNGNNVTLADSTRIRATGLDSGLPDFASNPGGTVGITAVNGVNASGLIDTTGFNDGGGRVRLTGDTVTTADATRIFANGGNNGNGGRVLLQGTTSTDFAGRIQAQGGDTAGNNGGFVSFNQPNTISPNGTVDVSAANGTAGTFNN